jgi:hypothetical protein
MHLNLRLEAKKDHDTGKWYVTLHLPDEIVGPIASTKPIFDTLGDAISKIGLAIKKLIKPER